MSEALRHPLLRVEHGFGVRRMSPPDDVVRPLQVHGVEVARIENGAAFPGEADAILASSPGACVGVITADCVPILLSDESGGAVAAIHAGWRGLTAGVVERGIAALRTETSESLVAVIGPHIGVCCYEVDAPVIDACRERFGAAADAAIRLNQQKAGHAMLELARLVEIDLERGGLAAECVARLEPGGSAACTNCDAERFHSYRRDGERSGRLLHFIRASGKPGPGGTGASDPPTRAGSAIA